MSKNTLLSELINYISANASGNVVIAAPSSGYALDVTGTGRYTSVLTLGSTLSINGGVLAGNNIVSMRANASGGQFRIEKSDGSLSAYPFYVGVDGTALAYYYNSAGTLKVLLHTDGTSYFGNNLSVGYSSYSAVTYSLDVNGTGRFTGALDANIISANSVGSTQIFLKSSGAGANRQWQIQSNETAAGDLSFMQSTAAGGSTYATKFNLGATGVATLTSDDNSGARTTINNVLTIKQTNGNAPYSGFGSAILFSGTTYNGAGASTPGVRSWGRIGMFLNDSSVNTRGESMFFQTAASDNSDTLGTAMIITPDRNILINTTADNGAKLQVAGTITQERNTGYSYSQTSYSGTTSIVDTYIDNNSFGQSSLYMVSYGGNPNAGGSGAYKCNYVGYISVTTGYIGGNVKRLISYVPTAQFDASGIGSLSFSVFFFNGTTETTTINEGSSSGYYIRLKITGYNSSYIGAEQYVYLTRLN